MLLNCGVGKDSWESLGLQGDPTSPSERRSVVDVHWKDWCRSRNSNTLATWCEEQTNLKRPWCWERLKVGGEGDDRGWDGWIASLTQWTYVWANSRIWWWTGRWGFPGGSEVKASASYVGNPGLIPGWWTKITYVMWPEKKERKRTPSLPQIRVSKWVSSSKPWCWERLKVGGEGDDRRWDD